MIRIVFYIILISVFLIFQIEICHAKSNRHLVSLSEVSVEESAISLLTFTIYFLNTYSENYRFLNRALSKMLKTPLAMSNANIETLIVKNYGWNPKENPWKMTLRCLISEFQAARCCISKIVASKLVGRLFSCRNMLVHFWFTFGFLHDPGFFMATFLKRIGKRHALKKYDPFSLSLQCR